LGGTQPAGHDDLGKAHDRWQVGVVRWVKHYDTARSNLGIHILGGRCTMTQVAKAATPDQVHSAVLLDGYEPGGERLRKRLLAPNGVYAEKAEYLLADGSRQFRIKAGTLIAAGRDCDCFDIEPA
jgi:hypothetical protein